MNEDDTARSAVPQRPAFVDTRPARMPRVLVVEDEALLCSFMCSSLSAAGFAVVGAASGGEALEVLKPGEAALAIVDIMLPGLDGLAIARELRARNPHVQVLFTSGYPYAHLAQRIVDLPRQSFLQKPFSRTDLLQFVAGAPNP